MVGKLDLQMLNHFVGRERPKGIFVPLCWLIVSTKCSPGRGTVAILGKKEGRECQVPPGELMCGMCTTRPDVTRGIAAMSKFASSPAKCHCELLEGIVRHLRTTRSGENKCARPRDEHLNDLPAFNHQPRHLPFPGALGEFGVDVSLVLWTLVADLN